MFLNPARSNVIIGWLAFAMGFGLPVSTALDNIMVAAIVIVWLFTGDWQGKLERLRRNPASYAIVLLVFLAAVGMTWGPAGSKENLRYFEKYAGLLLALGLFSLPLNAAIRQRAFMGFALATVLTFSASYAFFLGIIPAHWLPARLPTNPTVFKAHITHGFFMAIGAYVLLLMAKAEVDRRWRWGYGLAAALAAGNALIVQGRTGYLVLGVLTAYLFIQRFRWRGALASLALMVFAVLVAKEFPESALTSRMTLALQEMRSWKAGEQVEENSSMGVRMQFAATSLRLIEQKPLLGVGTGSYEIAYRAAIPEGQVVTNNPHNQYLLTAVQLGLTGLLLLLALFAVLWRLTGNMAENERLLARGVLLAYLVGNLFNSFLYDHSEMRFFSWAVGLLFCGASLSTRDAGSPGSSSSQARQETVRR